MNPPTVLSRRITHTFRVPEPYAAMAYHLLTGFHWRRGLPMHRSIILRSKRVSRRIAIGSNGPDDVRIISQRLIRQSIMPTQWYISGFHPVTHGCRTVFTGNFPTPFPGHPRHNGSALFPGQTCGPRFGITRLAAINPVSDDYKQSHCSRLKRSGRGHDIALLISYNRIFKTLCRFLGKKSHGAAPYFVEFVTLCPFHSMII